MQKLFLNSKWERNTFVWHPTRWNLIYLRDPSFIKSFCFEPNSLFRLHINSYNSNNNRSNNNNWNWNFIRRNIIVKRIWRFCLIMSSDIWQSDSINFQYFQNSQLWSTDVLYNLFHKLSEPGVQIFCYESNLRNIQNFRHFWSKWRTFSATYEWFEFLKCLLTFE